MNVIRLRHFAIRATALGALVATTAGVAVAQKVKPAGPPVVTQGGVKSNEHADKGQAKAEAARLEARENKAEKSALGAARREPKSLLKDISLTKAERKTTNAIEKRYADQFKELEKAEKAGEKAGTADVVLTGRIEALRAQQRAELRAALTPQQQAKFDNNAATLATKKK